MIYLDFFILIYLSFFSDPDSAPEMDLERRNTFKIFLRDLEIDGQVYKFYDVSQLNEEKYGNYDHKKSSKYRKTNSK